MKDDAFYQRVFSEICCGYSEAELDGEYVYIKHFNTKDYSELNQKEVFFLKKAKSRGLISEKEALKDAIDDGLWSENDDNEIDQLTIYIENLEKTKNNLFLKSEKANHEITLKEEREKLAKKISIKENITRNTADSYARKQLNDFYIFNSFYKSKDLSENLYKQSDYDELSYEELGNLIILNNKYQTDLSEKSIKQCVLQDFFHAYMFIAESPMEFYGKPIVDLSSYQLTLLMYSKIFKNIFDNVDNIPDKLRKDPDGLMEFASSSKERDKMKDNLSKDGSSTVFGATQEDYENMGVDQNLVKGKSIHEAAKRKGGTLNMEDLMKMS
jgi:hypothetical protein